MLKNILITILLFTNAVVIAQKDFEKSLDSLQTLDDVNIFFKKNKKVKGKVIVFNEEKSRGECTTSAGEGLLDSITKL